jgi:hypothetical protein
MGLAGVNYSSELIEICPYAEGASISPKRHFLDRIVICGERERLEQFVPHRAIYRVVVARAMQNDVQAAAGSGDFCLTGTRDRGRRCSPSISPIAMFGTDLQRCHGKRFGLERGLGRQLSDHAQKPDEGSSRTGCCGYARKQALHRNGAVLHDIALQRQGVVRWA